MEWAAGRRRDDSSIGASVLLISGCMDQQLSADGTTNGLFTTKLLEVWNNGNFQGSYTKFWQDIQQRMPLEQSPNYYKVGAANPAFESQKPFTIGENGTTPRSSGKPTVQDPNQWSQDAGAPTFTVNKGYSRPGQKGFWDDAWDIATEVGPIIYEALTKNKDFQMGGGASVYSQPAEEKFLNILVPVLASAIPAVLNALTKNKDFQMGNGVPSFSLATPRKY